MIYMIFCFHAAQARPFLHDFMAAVYPFYDIIIWSATSMKWVEVSKTLPQSDLAIIGHNCGARSCGVPTGTWQECRKPWHLFK